jgi:hypothetical protein
MPSMKNAPHIVSKKMDTDLAEIGQIKWTVQKELKSVAY